MTHNSTDRSYNIYSVSLKNSIIVKEGVTSLVLMILTNDIFKTSAVEIKIGYENFKIAQKANMLDELSRNLSLTYKKIEELTKMNIEIYKNIEEVINK